MVDPIRLLHFADTHIGMENYGKISPQSGISTRVEDFLRRMDEMIAYAKANDVDLTIFAGDAFKTRTPNPTFQREFAYRIRDLTELAPVVMLVGNHDLPPMARKASSIEIYDTLAVPNVWVAADYESRVVKTKRGPVLVGTAPYPIRARLLEELDDETAGKTIAEIDGIMQETLAHILLTLAEEADAYDMPRVLTGHFTIEGATLGSERQVMLGRDISVPRSFIADPRWDYVAMGHIHKHQNLTKGRDDLPPVVYSGSMERIDFGEEGDAKGFCWVELEHEGSHRAVRWKFHKLSARPFVTISLDLRQSQNPTQDAVAEIEALNVAAAVVRMIVRLTPETEPGFHEGMVREVLRQQGVSIIASIRKEVEQAARARLGGNPEGMSDAELLERYLISKQVDPARREQLMKAAEGVFDVATIVREVSSGGR